jgi:hypothetical protein
MADSAIFAVEWAKVALDVKRLIAAISSGSFTLLRLTFASAHL